MSPTEERRSDIIIREAGMDDAPSIWRILEPVIRAGETYALPIDMTAEQAISFWFDDGHHVFIAVDGDAVLGTYFLCTNKAGGGDHVANAGYVTADRARGCGIARAMCLDSLERGRAAGFLALQFNFVVASNEGAVRLWQRLGFETVGRLPKVFRHPTAGLVDALVMHRFL